MAVMKDADKSNRFHLSGGFNSQSASLRPRRLAVVPRTISVLMALLVFACAQGASTSAAISWSVFRANLDGHVFPSAAIALATTKDPYNPFEVEVNNVPDGTQIKLVVSCSRIMYASTTSFTTNRNKAHCFAAVSTQWRFSRLAGMRQKIPADVMYTLYANRQELGRRMVPVVVNSVNACPYAFVDRKRHIVANLSPLFAAYVNPNDPALDGILKQALKSQYVKQFDGYQASPAGVIRQVAAIWLVLEQRGLHYSNIAAPVVEPGRIIYQRVRSVGQSLHSAQANCVDGTVLFASALERIGIACDLVHPPGHMFLRFFAAKGHKVPIYLETTMLGAHASINPHLVNPVGRVFPWYDFRDRPFEAAVQEGLCEAIKDSQAAARVKGIAAQKWLCSVISIARARKFGIMPLPASSRRGGGR